MKETDLFAPVQHYLTRLGYKVDAEVKDCDVVALYDDDLLIVELKLNLNLKLLIQATDRQSISTKVYIAVPHPRKITKHWKKGEKLIRRLGLGLLTIKQSPLGLTTTLRFEPNHKSRINKRRQTAVLAELKGRIFSPDLTIQGSGVITQNSVDTGAKNIGGSNGVRIFTAYRQTALTIATLLEQKGELKVSEIRPLAGVKTQSILAKNHYGWFERVKRGTYKVTAQGLSALDEDPELYQLAKALIQPT